MAKSSITKCFVLLCGAVNREELEDFEALLVRKAKALVR